MIFSNNRNRQVYSICLSVCFGGLLSLPWLLPHVGILSLFAFLPLFFSIRNLVEKGETWLSYFAIIYIGLFTWTICSVWWIANSTFGGLMIAIFFFPLYMSIPFLLSQFVMKQLGLLSAYFSFIVFWLSCEYLTLHLDIAWPWLLLGNAFARDVLFVQWYEHTGILGGSLWILLSNGLAFLLLKKNNEQRIFSPLLILFALLIVVPIVFSVYRYNSYLFSKKQLETVIVQPNINSYTEKFAGKNVDIQIGKMLHLADSLISSQTHLLVLPETALPNPIIEDEIDSSFEIKQLRNFISKHPRCAIICGAITERKYDAKRDGMQNYFSIKHRSGMFVQYNSALYITNKSMQIYRKSKLLPGVETMPFADYIPQINKLLFNFGGQGGSFGTQTERTVFRDSLIALSSLICYESAFGDFVSQFANNGAEAIAIITNDGWWGNTPGYQQHLSFACLRAIELRRDIARCANTGISSLINLRGDLITKTNYGVADVIKIQLRPNKELTFYTLYGDYLGWISLLLSTIILLWIFCRKYFASLF